MIKFKWNLLQLLFRYKERILEVDLSGLVLSFPLLSGIPFSSNPLFLLSIRSSTWLTHTPFSNILRYFSGFG